MLGYNIIKWELQQLLLILCTCHVSLFLVSNGKMICESDKIHSRKVKKLILNNHDTSIIDYVPQDHDKVISKSGCFHGVIIFRKYFFSNLKEASENVY